MNRAKVMVRADDLAKVVTMLSQFVTVVGSEHADDGQVALVIEGDEVPAFANGKLVDAEITRYGRNLTLSFR